MTCTEESAKSWDPKHPDDTEIFIVDFEQECARYWKPKTDFALADTIRLRGRNAFEHELTTPGRTGAREPVFAESIGATTVDGSAIWTCRSISTASLAKTIAGIPTWVADTGVTVTGEAKTGLQAYATISGGTQGENYSIKVKAAFSDGTTRTATCVLPVRMPVRVCE